MEAAALYAYATARRRDVVCIAHVTNTMATPGEDFEKGDDNGTHRILAVVDSVSGTLASEHRSLDTLGDDDPDRAVEAHAPRAGVLGQHLADRGDRGRSFRRGDRFEHGAANT
jgi:hypothetical protein